MRTTSLLAFVICFAVAAPSRAQQSAPTTLAQPSAISAPDPNDGGPTLASTMRFIQDKINDRGAILDRFYYGDGSGVTPGDEGQKLSLIADPSNCLIKVTVTHADQTQQILTMIGSLKEVQRVTVGVNANPSIIELRAPRAIFQLRSEFDFDSQGFRLRVPNMYDDSAAAFRLRFHDPNMADRVAKAAQHAVEICGGATHSVEPF